MPDNKNDKIIPNTNKLKELFDLKSDKASNQDIIDDIRKDSVFKGPNLWILIFAIIICSVGLDINSTAVVIGGMLISPLMGPLMGIGMGLSRIDLDLIKTSGYNILIAMALSIATSALYFFISPLDKVQSELLSRTSPAIWDVIIAISGGIAGIIAYTRKEKNNVIPGVAIATALMPPLSTAGFGLASGNFQYFWGALYLFLINSIFIAIGTYIIIRILKIRRKQYVDPKREKKVKRIIIFLVLIFIAPSVYTAYLMVQENIFEKNANHFIKQELNQPGTIIISKKLKYHKNKPEIELTLYGNPLDSIDIMQIKSDLIKYNLKNTSLVINQGPDISKKMDISSIESIKENMKSDILKTIYNENKANLEIKNQKIKELNNRIKSLSQDTIPLKQIGKEASINYPEIESIGISFVPKYNIETQTIDTIPNAILKLKTKMRSNQLRKFNKWLQTRLNVEDINIVIQ